MSFDFEPTIVAAPVAKKTVDFAAGKVLNCPGCKRPLSSRVKEGKTVMGCQSCNKSYGVKKQAAQATQADKVAPPAKGGTDFAGEWSLGPLTLSHVRNLVNHYHGFKTGKTLNDKHAAEESYTQGLNQLFPKPADPEDPENNPRILFKEGMMRAYKENPGNLNNVKDVLHGVLRQPRFAPHRKHFDAFEAAQPKSTDFAANPDWWPMKGFSRKHGTWGQSISHGTLDSWLGNKQSKMLGKNKEVRRDENGDVQVILHRTPVVTAHANGDYTMNTGGYHTPTTKRTIAAITGLSPFVKKGTMHLGDGFPLEDGHQMTDYLAHVHDKTPMEGRKDFFAGVPESLHVPLMRKIEARNPPSKPDTLFDKTPAKPAKKKEVVADFSSGSEFKHPKYEAPFKLDKIEKGRAYLTHPTLGPSSVSVENLKKMQKV